MTKNDQYFDNNILNTNFFNTKFFNMICFLEIQFFVICFVLNKFVLKYGYCIFTTNFCLPKTISKKSELHEKFQNIMLKKFRLKKFPLKKLVLKNLMLKKFVTNFVLNFLVITNGIRRIKKKAFQRICVLSRTEFAVLYT